MGNALKQHAIASIMSIFSLLDLFSLIILKTIIEKIINVNNQDSYLVVVLIHEEITENQRKMFLFVFIHRNKNEREAIVKKKKYISSKGRTLKTDMGKNRTPKKPVIKAIN